MKIKLIEDPRAWPAQLDDFSLGQRHGNPREIQHYLGTEDMMRTGEQVRLLLSWDAVLREVGITEVGAGRW